MANILLLIPELGPGGAERAISRLSIELSKYHKVYLCRFTSRDNVIYPYSGKLVSLRHRNSGNLLSKIIAFVSRIRELRNLKSRYQIDSSISFLEGANYVNLLSKRKEEKVYISLRGSIYKDKDITGLLGYLRKKLLIPVLYKRANKVVALSNGLKEELIQFTGISDKKLLVIYNHYDFNELIQQVQQPLSELNKKIFNKRVIITSGRLHQSKGHREFLKVFAKLRVATDSRFVIFGDGDLRAELIQEAKNLDLSTYDVWSNMEFTEKHDVYFMGYIKDPFNFIASSTLFVFPSLYEGLGNSLVEALACSVPIVAADCHSGPREVLAPSTNPNFNLTTADFAEYGVLMPVLNNNSSTTIWVDVIAKLLQDDVLRKQYSSKTLTRLKDFSIKSISHQWSALLAEDSAK